MLVLRRNVGEEIIVSRSDGTVVGRIMVVDVRHGKARLGLSFGPEFDVDRLEVYEAKYPNEGASHAEGEPQVIKCERCQQTYHPGLPCYGQGITS